MYQYANPNPPTEHPSFSIPAEVLEKIMKFLEEYPQYSGAFSERASWALSGLVEQLRYDIAIEKWWQERHKHL